MLALVTALLVAALIAIAMLVLKKRVADNELRRAQEQAADLAKRAAALGQQVASVGRYQGIVEAESRAKELLVAALAKAADVAGAARRDAEAVMAEASAQKTRADAVLESATNEGKRIVDEASKRAEQITGDAYAAMQNMKELQQTARALKNVIEGYGDQYVVPTFSLLDELAEQFGFAEAGQRLKEARERVRQMVKKGIAAACNYVEENRRTTAIDFVVDAFNGKVDTVLADVRHDNFGTLEQKIKDAFQVVNYNGKAFRNARITHEYLQARLEELRWAVIAQELKQKEREEQRALKERIREEERAQREFERAMKEAEKEEEVLRNAMEKARREVEKASDEQKARYEGQLAELAEKLRAAEEKNQRALSMAQQTKAGHVYVISNVGSFGEHVYKVGLTRRLEPRDRIRELGDASVPFDFDVHALIRCDDAPALERELHKRFVRRQVNKVNPRKEFFRLPLQQIRDAVEKLGCQAQWTLTAECRDYKETLAIENAMKSQSFEEGAWLKRQLEEHDVAAAEPLVKDEAA